MPREAPPLALDPADLAALAAPLPLLAGDRPLVAANRIAYQPMEANDGEADGRPSAETLARYRARAEGGAGIDFVEALAVLPGARARERQLVIDRSTRDGLARLVEAYRGANPATPLLFQLTHSGPWARDPVGPVPVPGRDVRLLTDADLPPIRDAFVEAVRIAREVGADGVDFKHCHGYLCGAFLGPANRARPGWTHGGQSLGERVRFLLETLAAMTAEVPPDRFLYAVRISAYEGVPGGFGSRGPDTAEEDPEGAELAGLCRLLEARGVGLINQSAGVPALTPTLVRQTRTRPEGFALHQRLAAAIKRAVRVPVVGSGYSYPCACPGDGNVAERGGRAIREGKADLIGVGRQSLADPGFAAKLLSGRHAEIRWDTACSRCAVSLRSGIPAGCPTYDPTANRRYREMRRRSR